LNVLYLGEMLLGIHERVPEAKYALAHMIGCPGTSTVEARCISWADWFLDVLAGFFDEFPDSFWVEGRGGQ
jgi:hypothetical protein